MGRDQTYRGSGPYHTALAGGREEYAVPTSWWDDGAGSVALRHDILHPLPAAFQACDVMWAEPPWRSGYEEFNKRAGVADDRPDYQTFLGHVERRVVSRLPIPTFMTGGPGMTPHLTLPWQAAPILLNGGQALLFSLNAPAGMPAFHTTVDALEWLAARYGCVGDPCSGYGHTGKVFARFGKRFVLADVNAKCIGYIAAHAPAWRPEGSK